MRRIILFLLSFVFLVPLTNATDVLVVNVDTPITQATVELIKEALIAKPDIIIITLDTTGGEISSTFEIMKLIENSEVPFIGYVYPKGAKAWSAGTFVLLSTHIAVMSPYTVIGSSQPVSIGFDKVEMINESKVINALIAFMEERMKMHNRNVSIVSKYIKENLNLNEEEAKNVRAIEFIAKDINDLLDIVNNVKVNTSRGEILINTKGANIIHYTPSLKVKLMSIISDPIVASILLMIGTYALIFGLSNPGVGSEILGVLLIVLGITGIGFDVNIAGIILILTGAALILFELTTPSFGILGILGIAILILGIIFIGPLTSPNWYISKESQETLFYSIVISSIIFGLFLLFALFKVAEIKLKRPVIGNMIGDKAKVVDDISEEKEGHILYNGELWGARTKGGVKIKKDEEDKIIGKEEYHIIVEPIEKS